MRGYTLFPVTTVAELRRQARERAEEKARQTEHARSPATAEAIRGIPAIGAMGGATRYSRPDTMVGAMDDKRGVSRLLGSNLGGIPRLVVKELPRHGGGILEIEVNEAAEGRELEV